MLLFGAAIISGLFCCFVKQLGGYEDLEVGHILGMPPRYGLVLFMSLMTIGVGFLSGKGGFWFGAGGFICYWLLSPVISMTGSPEMQTMVGDARPNAFVRLQTNRDRHVDRCCHGRHLVAFP